MAAVLFSALPPGFSSRIITYSIQVIVSHLYTKVNYFISCNLGRAGRGVLDGSVHFEGATDLVRNVARVGSGGPLVSIPPLYLNSFAPELFDWIATRSPAVTARSATGRTAGLYRLVSVAVVVESSGGWEPFPDASGSGRREEGASDWKRPWWNGRFDAARRKTSKRTGSDAGPGRGSAWTPPCRSWC